MNRKVTLNFIILLSIIYITGYAQQGSNWYVDNEASGANNSTSVITIDSDKTIKANYTLRQEQNIHYILADANGNNDGSDWTNAWNSFPETLERGHTYYVAGGYYSGCIFDDPEDGNQYIYIKKAVTDEHGTNTGWNDSYGTTQAVFTHSIQFETGYWVWDGVTGSNNDESSYGFKIEVASGTESDSHHQLIRLINTGEVLHNMEIRHTAMQNLGVENPSSQICIYSPAFCINAVIAYNYMYNPQYAMLIRNWNNCTIENNYFGPNWSNSDYHGGSISTSSDTSITVRNNIFESIVGSGIIHVVTNTSSDWYIYGNIFINGSTGRPSISAGGEQGFFNVRAYNNTFINQYHAGVHGSNGSGNIAFNNVFYNCEMMYFANCDHYYNWYYGSGDLWEPEDNYQIGTGNPFLDYENGNYRLISATEPGMSLSGFNNLDPDGTVRGQDGTIDRGAYEYSNSQGVGNSDPVITTMKLYQNYPNPFSTETIFEYELPGPSIIEVLLYNIAGRKVKTFYSGMQSKGSHEEKVNGDGLSSGVYFFSIQGDNFKGAKKCLLIK